MLYPKGNISYILADNKAIASKLDEVTEAYQRALRDCDMKDQALLAIREEKNVVDERLAVRSIV